MKKFLKQWINAQLSFLLWGFLPWVITLLFSILSIVYFRSYAYVSTGLFIIFTFIIISLYHWFTRNR